MQLSIQPVTSIEECRTIEQMSLEIWATTPIDVVPSHITITIAKESGQVLLARLADGTPVGFGLAFLARTDDGLLKLASHQVGVLPAYRSDGIGYQIKLAQREEALARGIRLITWTFDPLQGLNARLNLHKLGAVSQTYIRNIYGAMRDSLNKGLESDRFRVAWWLDSPHVSRRLAGEAALPVDPPILNAAAMGAAGYPLPVSDVSKPTTATCLVEMPPEINAIKRDAPHIARAWQLQLRELAEGLFAAGYTLTDLVRREGRNYYLFARDFDVSMTDV